MDAGPGTDLGALSWYLGIWVTMTAAMMLPSAAPAVSLCARARGDAQAGAFVAGYLIAWTLYGLAAYAVYRGVRAASPSFLAWDEHGPWVAGGALAAAGLYQLTPLKSACLRHCRSPLHFLMRGRTGVLGAVWMGIEHGAICVGCCLGLMLALFALGVMSLFWMGAAGVAILIEKAMPGGEAFARALALVLVGLGIWVAAAPGSVPGLTQPGAMQMQSHEHMDTKPAMGGDGDAAMSWRIRGSYFESCNCDAICPCRRIDGVPGGRSTHGECMGVLSWMIEDGEVDGVDVAGLPVAMAIRYSDDEPGSPWTWVLYLDRRATSEQLAALEGVFTGRLGGDASASFPWAWKASKAVGVRPVTIDVDHTRRRQRLRIRDRVSVRIRDRYDGEETVSCGISGHHRAGEELVTDELLVEDDELRFAYRGTCGYGSTFDYASA